MPANAHPDDLRDLATRRGLHTDRLPETIDRDTYTPALIGLLNNLLVWGGSRVFSDRHNIGTNEWRILSALGNHPGATASELCDVLGMNKSIASKSVNLLLDRELVAQLGGSRGARHLYLTDAGVAVHDAIMPIALRRAEILHSTLSEAEVAQLQSLLVRMLSSADDLQSYERSLSTEPAAGTTRTGANADPAR